MGARETRDRSKRMNRIIPENVDGVSMRAQWVSSPEIMSSFTKEELEEMAKKISDIVEQFITYDIETTNTGILKGLDKQGENEQNGTQFVI